MLSGKGTLTVQFVDGSSEQFVSAAWLWRQSLVEVVPDRRSPQHRLAIPYARIQKMIIVEEKTIGSGSAGPV